LAPELHLRSATRGRRRAGADQRGETLLESLIAIIVLTLVAIAAYTGLQTTVRSTARHESSAVSETLLRSAAEQLQHPESPYIDLAGCGANPTYTGLPTEPGYGQIQVAVSFWVPPTGPLPAQVATTFDPACPASDPGLQQLELSVVTPSGATETLDVLKRRG
jgi:type II secretory pathway pseudopilin PulG